MSDLILNAEEFYITAEHRHAALVITGGNDGESIDEIRVLAAEPPVSDATRGHSNTWNTYEELFPDKLIFKNGKITLTDNCVTDVCNITLLLEISYHERNYQVSLSIYTVE